MSQLQTPKKIGMNLLTQQQLQQIHSLQQQKRQTSSSQNQSESSSSELVSSSKANSTNIKLRQRVSRACLNCQKAHMSCEDARPCKRCIDREMTDKCCDIVPKKRGRKRGSHLKDEKELRPPRIKRQRSNKADSSSSSASSSPENSYDFKNAPFLSSNPSLHYYSQTSSSVSPTSSSSPSSSNVQTPYNNQFHQFIPPNNTQVHSPSSMSSPSSSSSNFPVPHTLLSVSPSSRAHLDYFSSSNLMHPNRNSSSPNSYINPNSDFDSSLPPLLSYNTKLEPNEFSNVQSSLMNRRAEFSSSNFSNPPIGFSPPTKEDVDVLSFFEDQNFSFMADFFSPIDQVYAWKWSSLSVGEREYYEKRGPLSTSVDEFFQKFLIALRSRIPNEAAHLTQKIFQLRAKMFEYRETVSRDTAGLMIKELETSINLFKNVFDDLAVPALVWERCGIVHYVNQPFIQLTGFNSPLPTDSHDFTALKLLSPVGLKTFIYFCLSKFMDRTVNSITFACGIRDFKAESKSEVYRGGTMSITIKRDVLGLPLVFQGCFLPYLKNE